MQQKLSFFLLVFLLYSFTVFADYTSPGTGVKFDLDSLVTYSGGAVTRDSENFYIHQSVIISRTDTLMVLRSSNVVFTDQSGVVQLDINGAFFATGSIEDSIIFTSQNSSYGDYYGIRYRNTALGSDFQMRYCIIEFATRAIDILNADATIENCLIQWSGHTAVDLSSSNSTIANCIIRRNVQRTIFMTLNSSPFIHNNYIYENNSENTSPYPFINIGLQGVNSPIISNNVIFGGNEMSGGIAIWNASNAEINNNTIENCGYGILCFQQNANPLIKNNQISHNTIHPDTLNWGFGIACNGSNAPVISGNIIESNYYGIAIINGAQPNIGNLSNADTTDNGKNHFLGNGIGNNKYELYNNNSLPIMAENNWWGTNHPDSIESRIVHQLDNPAFGLVDFNPFILNDPLYLEEDNGHTPADIEIFPAYPNPFNPITTIPFKIRENSLISINIYNVNGEKIKTLFKGNLKSGIHKIQWEGFNEANLKVSSGIYFYEITNSIFMKSGKLILLK